MRFGGISRRIVLLCLAQFLHACELSSEFITSGTVECRRPSDAQQNTMLLIDGTGTNLLGATEYSAPTEFMSREAVLSKLRLVAPALQAVEDAQNLQNYMFFSSSDDFARLIVTDVGGDIRFDTSIVWNGDGRIRTPAEWSSVSMRLPEPARVAPSCERPRPLRAAYLFSDPARVRGEGSLQRLENWLAASGYSTAESEAIFFINRSDRATLFNAFWIVLPAHAVTP